MDWAYPTQIALEFYSLRDGGGFEEGGKEAVWEASRALLCAGVPLLRSSVQQCLFVTRTRHLQQFPTNQEDGSTSSKAGLWARSLSHRSHTDVGASLLVLVAKDQGLHTGKS